MRHFSIISLAVVLFGFLITTHADPIDKGYLIPVGSNEIKVMSYNIQNLFDWKHDQGKEDYEFLPINDPAKKNCREVKPGQTDYCRTTDWTYTKFNVKLGQIKKIMDAQGVLPDVFTTEEMENSTSSTKLAQALGYKKFVMTDSPDERGIDVALFYKEDKLSFIDFREVTYKYENSDYNKDPTRNLLIVHFKIKSSQTSVENVIGFYVVHLPSQANPAGKRWESAKIIKSEIQKDSKRFSNYHYVILGDFNTISADNPNAIDDVFLTNNGGDKLFDVATLYYENKEQDSQQMFKHMPKGTYYYAKGKEWNYLDHIFTSRNLTDRNSSVQLVEESFRIIAPSFSKKKCENSQDPDENSYEKGNSYCEPDSPIRYNVKATTESNAGFSDHFAIAVKIKIE